ncbi:MAG: hypothetical protein ACYS7M_04335, partial [Planctomycetota bacterium]
GADHQAFGDALTTKWKFPRHLRAAVGFHHSPERLSPELQKLGYTVHVADILCCEQKLGFYQTSEGLELNAELLEIIGLTEEQLEQVKSKLQQELEDAEHMLIG